LHVRHGIGVVAPVAHLEVRNAEPCRRAEDGPRGRIGGRGELGGDHRHIDSLGSDRLDGARQILRCALRQHVPSRPHREVGAVESGIMQPLRQLAVIQLGQMLGEEIDWGAWLGALSH
jgi:hypothetical protein